MAVLLALAMVRAARGSDLGYFAPIEPPPSDIQVIIVLSTVAVVSIRSVSAPRPAAGPVSSALELTAPSPEAVGTSTFV